MKFKSVLFLPVFALIFLSACDDSAFLPGGELQNLRIIYPLEGDTLRAPAAVQLTVEPFADLRRVELFMDGEEITGSAESPFPLELDVRPWADNAEHWLSLRASGPNGLAITSDPVFVTVSATASGPSNGTYFDRRFGDGTEFLVSQEVAGGWLLGGRKNGKAWLLRVDHKGDTVWDYSYGESEGRIRALLRASDGRILVAGSRDNTSWFARLDHNGNLLEDNLYQDIGSAEVKRMLALDDGDFLLALNVEIGEDQWLPRLKRVDAAGIERWGSEPFGLANGTIESVLVRDDGSWLFALTETREDGLHSLLSRTDQFGSVYWVREIGTGRMTTMLPDNGQTILAGTMNPNQGPIVLRRCDTEGTLLEQRVINAEGAITVRAMIARDDHWLLLGTRFSSSLDILLAHADFEQGMGDFVIHGGGLSESGELLLELQNGELLVAGDRAGEAWLLRTNAIGVLP